MSVHISNFGSFGSRLTPFQDLNGYVPEQGDSPEDFSWGHDEFTKDFDDNGDGYEGYAQETWAEFVDKAEEALAEASEETQGWSQNG